MHIHFGIHTDHFAQLTGAPFGEITLGRAGLLNVLECRGVLPLDCFVAPLLAMTSLAM